MQNQPNQTQAGREPSQEQMGAGQQSQRQGNAQQEQRSGNSGQQQGGADLSSDREQNADNFDAAADALQTDMADREPSLAQDEKRNQPLALDEENIGLAHVPGIDDEAIGKELNLAGDDHDDEDDNGDPINPTLSENI
jgi:seryl-tRNA synthetase